VFGAMHTYVNNTNTFFLLWLRLYGLLLFLHAFGRAVFLAEIVLHKAVFAAQANNLFYVPAIITKLLVLSVQ
jgi:hypothetical protein